MPFECSICCENEEDEPTLECCGMKYCLLCMHKTAHLCHVCHKDKLNEPIGCDVCGVMGNSFTIQLCQQIPCDNLVCGDCNKSNVEIYFCTWRHLQEWIDVNQPATDE